MEPDNYRRLWLAIQRAANKRDMEELMDACADYFDVDADAEVINHSEVEASLRSGAEYCRRAAMNYYASFK